MKLKESFFVLIALMSHSATAAIQTLELDFDDGVDSWRVVLDGVMGGRSSGRIVDSEPGLLVFNGNLSLENNGGFSQIRTNINEGSLSNQEGLEIRFLGDGRTYQFDIRVSNVRLMAGGFQTNFDSRSRLIQSVHTIPKRLKKHHHHPVQKDPSKQLLNLRVSTHFWICFHALESNSLRARR